MNSSRFLFFFVVYEYVHVMHNEYAYLNKKKPEWLVLANVKSLFTNSFAHNYVLRLIYLLFRKCFKKIASTTSTNYKIIKIDAVFVCFWGGGKGGGRVEVVEATFDA